MSRTSTRLPSEGELLGHGEADVRDQQALDDGVGGRMDEHHGARERAALLQRIPEKEVVVVLEPHAAEDDHVDFGLQSDAREERVVGLARPGEDGELLGSTRELKMSIMGMPVRTMLRGMMRLAGLTDGPPISIGLVSAGPWSRGCRRP